MKRQQANPPGKGIDGVEGLLCCDKLDKGVCVSLGCHLRIPDRLSEHCVGRFSLIVVRIEMKNFLSELRVKILVMRVLLGLIFAVLLSRLFFPNSNIVTIPALAGLLVFFAYVLEYLHRGKRP
jgi:hypothetical protein